MMQISYSRIGTFESCPFKYDLLYNQKLGTIFNCDPTNALVLGTALHTGIEKDVKTAIEEYYSNYPIVNDLMINEAIKLENLIPKAANMLPEGEYEVKIDDEDFVGFIDLLAPAGKGLWLDSPEGPIECNYYDIYDFKYSNNIERYLESEQLHLYKYFFEKQNPTKRIRNLYYVIVPKTMIRQKKTEDLYQFRKRLQETLKTMEPQIIEVKYDYTKIIEFLLKSKKCIECTDYQKNPNRLCDWCDYKKYCEKGEDIMILPKNEKREKVVNLEPDMWIYADSYVGKSTFVDQLDDVIFANTDGNVENITSPYVTIANEIVKEGRVTKSILAWEKFLEFVDELEKGKNTFKVVALDLLEDLYEHCRLYMYDKLGIEHEQDAGFGKGWDMVRTEFCSTIKRLKHLGYRIIYISKEIKTEINLKNGSKLTSYGPNINERVANILAGTVTITLRAYMDNRGRFLQLAKSENIFGGGRFDFVNSKCELDMNAFIEELKLAQKDKKAAPNKNISKSVKDDSENVSEATEAESEEAPKPTRKRRTTEADTESTSEESTTENADEESTEEEKPVRRRRRVKED